MTAEKSYSWSKCAADRQGHDKGNLGGVLGTRQGGSGCGYDVGADMTFGCGLMENEGLRRHGCGSSASQSQGLDRR